MKQITLHWEKGDKSALRAIKYNPKDFYKLFKHWMSKTSGDNTVAVRGDLLSIMYEFIMGCWHFLQKGMLWLFVITGFAMVMFILLKDILLGLGVL